jgi:hypothetical protein
MKDIIQVVQMWDDFALAEGRKEHADVTVKLGLNGKWREVDLTNENAKKLLDIWERMCQVGRIPDQEVLDAPVEHVHGHKPELPVSAVGPDGKAPHNGSRARRDYLAKVREFADLHGFNYRVKNPGIRGGDVERSHNQYTYSKPLLAAYEEQRLKEEALEGMPGGRLELAG